MVLIHCGYPQGDTTTGASGPTKWYPPLPRSGWGGVSAPYDMDINDLDPKNVDLLRRYVTDQGRILPRKYTGLPARYQRRLTRSIKRARQMLLMK